MNNKKQNEIDNLLEINARDGRNDWHFTRDEILHMLLQDETINELLGGNNNERNEHLYWDDVDLVSDYYDNQTITSRSSDQKQTIGDMKKDIIEFCAKQKREIEKHNDHINYTCNVLSEVFDNIYEDVFYDMRWDDEQDEDEDKQHEMLMALKDAMTIIKKERK